MITNTFVRKAVQVEYAMLRTPLAAVNSRLSARLGDGSKIRHSVELGLRTLDSTAHRLLQSPAAAEPAGRATAAEPKVSRPPAAAATAPPADEVERVAEEMLEDLEQKPITGELADPDLDVAEVQAQLRAKHLLEEQAERHQQS